MPISNSGAEGAFGLPQKFPIREANIPSPLSTLVHTGWTVMELAGKRFPD